METSSMKIVGINGLQSGSPSTIMRGIATVAASEFNFSYKTYFGNWKNSSSIFKESHRFGYLAENIASGVISRYLGIQNRGSIFGTSELIHYLEDFKPDIIHLHNIHFWTINVPHLFRYIKENKIATVWTLHDCWAFTGRCPYFQCTECDRWKTGCNNCVYPSKDYPASFVDCTNKMWDMKKEWFTGVDNMHLVTPSKWLRNLVKQSFLSRYDVSVINNGIDLSIFKFRESSFRKKYNIGLNTCILLGVALEWGYYKGLDIFIELSKKLENNYQIVLVGVDERLMNKIPNNIIAISRTKNANELVDIYCSADFFVNPTREENYPTVNMEAICCGTPVITFNTGGCAEIVDSNTGCVTSDKTSDAIIESLMIAKDKRSVLHENCLVKAKDFDMNSKYREYCNLYNKILNL